MSWRMGVYHGWEAKQGQMLRPSATTYHLTSCSLLLEQYGQGMEEKGLNALVRHVILTFRCGIFICMLVCKMYLQMVLIHMQKTDYITESIIMNMSLKARKVKFTVSSIMKVRTDSHTF